jgi:hypothetical protein
MILKKLLQTNSWLSVSAILLELYTEQEKNISGYEELYEKLLFMNAEDSEITICVENVEDDFDGEQYVDVCGKYLFPKNEEEEYSQAIEFTAWNKWLGMEISEESLQSFTELEIIAHCLFEMTFVGFEEEEIQEKLNALEQDVEEYKNMTDEEKKANKTSLEDIFKDLENY